MSGFVKLFRAINQNELLSNDNNSLVVFIKILTMVDRHTGSFTTGRYKFAAACNLKPSTLYGVLSRLESSTIIRQETNRNSTTIYLCNWWKYQQDTDRKSAGTRLKLDTIQEGEEEGEEVYKAKEKKKTVRKPQRDVISILNRVTGRNFSVEPLGIEKTKAMFTDEQIETALKNMYKHEWHKPRMKELKADYLLRATTIDQFKDYESKAERYVQPGTMMKETTDPRANLTRAELARMEYENV